MMSPSFRRPHRASSRRVVKDDGVVDMIASTPAAKDAPWAATSLAEEASRHVDFRLAGVTYPPPPLWMKPGDTIAAEIRGVSHHSIVAEA